MKQFEKLTLLEKLKAWAKKLKRDLKALQIALADGLVPWYVKALIALTVAYALSPVDLIPDFIPILGLLDDLIIVPFLIYITIKLIPEKTMLYCRQQADTRHLNNKKYRFAGGIIILLWLGMFCWLIIYIIKNVS